MHLERLKDLWPEIEPLLDQLFELDEPERSRLLDRALAGSPEARRAVESLLRSDREAQSPLDIPLALAERLDGGTPVAVAPPGTRIGAYVVREEIGRGGMGVVLLADRADGQFDQRVAIKLIRSDGLTPGTRERFLLERRILASLEHPHIARLIDGGVREDGSPFLVMEYVEGLPITRWCDRRRLDLRARVELFRQACEAVEFAHGRLIVHRDLKPDNILVTERGEVKLLDFGIAKLLEPTTPGAMTGTHARLFTPAYATPEQYLGEPITAVTDEYQLALVLYEILTGGQAYASRSGSPLSHQRAVLETEPDRPSRRVTRAPEVAPPPKADLGPAVASSAVAVAEARGSSGPALAKALSGDLDAIVLKALEREPRHRYPSVEAFRRDLENYLADHPVAARRATAGYRIRKFGRRHRFAITAGVMVLAALTVGLVAVLMQARIVERERDLARESERKATALNDFVLRELLESPTPERTLGRPLTVAEVLDGASRTVDNAFRDQPLTEAAVRTTLARSYEALGRLDAARDQAEKAQRLVDARLPPTARERLEARALMGELALDQGRFDEAAAVLARLAVDQSRVLGAADPATLRTQANLGRALSGQGRDVAADSTLRAAIAAMPPPGDSPWRLAVDLRGALAANCIEQGRATEAEALLRQSLALEHRHLGPDHPMIVGTLRQMAGALGRDLRYGEAGRVLDDVLQMSLRLYGENHPATADAYNSIAANRDARLMHAEALDATTHALAIYRRTLGDEHPRTLRSLRNLGVELRGARRFREADPVYQEAVRTCRRTLGPDHWQTIEAEKGLLYLRLDEQRVGEARAIAQQIIATYARIAAKPDAEPSALADFALFLIEAEPADVRDPQRAVVVAHRAVAATERQDYEALRALGFTQSAAGDPRSAIASLREALALPDGVRSWTTEMRLVRLLEEHGTPGELEGFLLARLESERTVRGADDRYIGKTLRFLSLLYHRTGRDSLAEHYARETLAQLTKTLPASHWEVGRAKTELGALLAARRAYAEAESLMVQGYRALEADPEIRSSDLEDARHSLVAMYQGAGRPREAAVWRERDIPVRTLIHN